METPPAKGRTLVFALVAVIVVLGAAFGLYFVQTSGTVSSQSAKLSSDAGQITADEAKVANLTQAVAADSAQISTLNARISSLRAGYSNANGTISTLDSQVSALNSQVSTLNAQITSDNSQIGSLQSQIISLQAIESLSSNSAEVTSHSFTTNSSGLLKLVTFAAPYAGYVSVTATASSDPAHVGCFVTMSFAANVVSPDFGGIVIPGGGYFLVFGSLPSTIVFPVTPGTVAVYLTTADTAPQNATLAVTYFY